MGTQNVQQFEGSYTVLLYVTLYTVIIYYYYLFITCNWVDTRWQQLLHVTLARTVKILL